MRGSRAAMRRIEPLIISTVSRRPTMHDTIWDVAFMKAWEESEAAARRRVVSDADYAIARQLGERTLSDSVGGYRLCQVRSCRRHRACRTAFDVCTALSPLAKRQISHHAAVEAQYAQLQKQRRDAAMADAK
jgi:hypothetical protein